MASQYYNTDLNSSRVNVRMPEYDTSGLLKAGQAIGDSMNFWKDKDLEAYKFKKDQELLAMDKARLDMAATELGMKQAEVGRVNKERTATNEAIQAAVNPSMYGATKVAEEQKAIQDSLANLSPEDRLAVEQQLKVGYNPETSKQSWLTYAPTVSGVDTNRLLEAKNKDYEVKAKTPGTPEYIAAEQAKMNLFKQEQAISHANRLGEIGAQNAGQIGYLRAQQDAPREMVDPTIGKAYFVKPSEMANYPSNLIAKDTLSSFLTNSRKQSKIEQDRRKYEQEKILKGKEALAGTVAVLGNQDSTLTTIGDMTKLAQDMGVTLTDADLSNSIKATTNGSSWTDRGKPDVDTSLLRDRLMQVISSQSKKPLEDVLKKSEGKVDKTPIVGSTSDNQPFSLFGVTAPTEYNAIQNTGNYGVVDQKEAAAKAKYALLPEYVKKDVSLSKYMDSPNSYEALIRK